MAALLITLALATAIFFGGRFAYNKIAGNDDDKDQKPGISDNGGSQQGSSSPGNGGTNNQGQQPPQQPQVPTPAPSTPAPANPPPAQSNPTTPSLGDTSMPRTGDEGM